MRGMQDFQEQIREVAQRHNISEPSAYQLVNGLLSTGGGQVQFNVTSLDVIHSFWAYTLGVKADANPGLDNVAYTTPEHTGYFQVRCSELCGIWHGSMYDTGDVVSVADFLKWTQTTKVQLADVTKLLPAYADSYDPTDISTLGAVNVKLGLTGAGGGFYNPVDPEQP